MSVSPMGPQLKPYLGLQGSIPLAMREIVVR